MGEPLPSVGRIVHYYAGADWASARIHSLPDHGPFAAMVVDVGPEPTTCTLRVWDRDGNPHIRREVKYDPRTGPMTWSWPPRVGN